jgi:hypothetical protein
MGKTKSELAGEGWEPQVAEDAIADGEGLNPDADDPTLRSEGFPYASQEEIGVQIPAVEIVGPPAYGSPDPDTSAGRLVALRNHPLSADNAGEDHPSVISDDYGQDVENAQMEFGREGTHHGPPSLTDLERDASGGGGGSYDEMTVSELKDQARDREIEGFSSMNKKQLVKALEKDDAAADDTNNS